jgi:prepilin-type N-terminal cleavage/methylation domain-containing protein
MIERYNIMKIKTGFTLIELLIVIALLGALAIGLLATIDPFEQLKKGRDTSTRNTAIEFYNASLRYYGTKGTFPWGATYSSPVSLTTSTMTPAITELINAGELKANFTVTIQPVQLGRISLVSPQTDQMTLCFSPESKNFRLDPNATYNQSGTMIAGCGSGTSTQCYWCVH